MIYDKRAEPARYLGLSPNLDATIRSLQTTDLTALPTGRTEVPGGDTYYNHFIYTTALVSQSSLFETHERYLDLHIVLSGCEQVALAPVESPDEAEVRADEDSIMCPGTPEYSATLDQNRFLLVFPGEGHLPKLSDSAPMSIDKPVLKIPCWHKGKLYRYQKYQGVIPAFYAYYDGEGNTSSKRTRVPTRYFLGKRRGTGLPWAALPASTSDWLEALYVVLARLGSRYGLSRVAGISFCGQIYSLVVLDKMDRVVRPTFARVTDGAAKSPVWLPTLSNMLELELCTINIHDGGALGAVLLAMTGFGRLSDTVKAAQAVIRDVDRSLSDPEHHYLYADNLGSSGNYTVGIQSSLAHSHLTEVEHPSDGLIESQQPVAE